MMVTTTITITTSIGIGSGIVVVPAPCRRPRRRVRARRPGHPAAARGSAGYGELSRRGHSTRSSL